jgi:hypothetical protein
MIEPTASGSSKTWELGRREGSANQGKKNKRKMLNKTKKNQSFDTMQEALDFINNFTGSHGYGLTTKSSKSKNGAIVVKYLQCDRGGAYRSRIDEDRRRRQGALLLA